MTNEVALCSAAGHSYTNGYQYDRAGNRWSRTRVTGGGTTTVTNLYDANDQLLREVTLDAGGAPTATNSYAYDANGSVVARTNLSSGGTVAVLYTYNLANKLSRVTTGGSTTSYLYNDSGIRVRSWAAGGNPTLYLVDGNNPTGYAQVLEEFTGATPTLAMSYVIGDDVLGQAAGSSASYLLYDGHGSTRQVVDNAVSVTSRYNYDAYGVAQANSYNEGGTSLRYCGEQYDSTLNMYNLRARFYDPSNGRFNARDTFAGNNYDPQSLHKYAYCHGDPINGMDPSGNFTLVELLVTITVVVVLAVGIRAALNSKDGRKFRMATAIGRSPNPSERIKLNNAEKLLIDKKLVEEDAGIDIMMDNITLVSRWWAGDIIGLSVPGTFKIKIQDTWLMRASEDVNANDIDTKRVAVQIFGEGQHAINIEPDSPEAEKKLNEAIAIFQLQNDPEVSHWHHGDTH